VRGGQFTEREGSFYIQSPTYIMDGLQRISAARELVSTGHEAYLGATAYFNTTAKWERERFRILNAERVHVSPNVLLRNIRGDNVAVKLAFELTTKDKNFVLFERVTWQQNQKRTEVLTALVLLKVMHSLHAHEGITGRSSWEGVAQGMESLLAQIGKATLTNNITTFFNVLDECWSIRNVIFTERQSHLKANFLQALADVFSRHLNFWIGPKLWVERPLVKKVAGFPLHDPEVKALCGAGGQSRRLLMHMIVDHINSGKRTKRLRPRTKEECDPVAVDPVAA
jgi:hypothetical protein